MNKVSMLSVLIIVAILFGFANVSPAKTLNSILIHSIQIDPAETLLVDMQEDIRPPRTACTPSPTDCSLRGAILHVEQNLSGIKVITLPMGRYKLSVGPAGTPNPLRIRSSLSLVGEGQDATFIDGDQKSQVFIVGGTGEPIVNIRNVTIELGRGGSGVPGGAIYVYEGAYLGLHDSTVRNSGSNGPGGGIANNGFLQLTGSTVIQNKAPIVGAPMTGGTQHSGGGIMNFKDAVLKIDSSTISYNEATRGGGIRNAGGHMEITNSTISNNRAFARGGGIMNAGTAFIAFSTITDNEANIFRLECDVDQEAFEEFRACGGGIYNNEGIISIGNSILAGNTDNRTRLDTGYSPDCFSPVRFSFTSFRGNLVGILTANCDMRDTIWGDQRFDMVGTPEVPLDPKLDLLRNNGGLTATHALLPGSPAIDNGTGVTSATFFDCPSVDQRGLSRPQAADCDIGAYEVGVLPPPTNTPTLAPTMRPTKTPPSSPRSTPTLKPTRTPMP